MGREGGPSPRDPQSTFSHLLLGGGGSHAEPKTMLKRKYHTSQAFSLCPLMSTAFAFMNVLQVTFASESADLNSHLLGSLLGYPS